PDGPHACPKGLRHGFGVHAVSRGIALNMVQKWLGHAQLTTTAIYANAVGEEEQSIAARMWCAAPARTKGFPALYVRKTDIESRSVINYQPFYHKVTRS